jgi:VanZ family protein
VVALSDQSRIVTASPGLVHPERRRWTLPVLALYLAAVAAVLVSPVSPEAIVAGVTVWLRDTAGLGLVRQGWVEFAANVALFAPLGALSTLAFRRPGLGVAAAVVFSAGAEIGQLMLPGRVASPRDVVANVLGAALGSAFALAVAAVRSRARAVRAGEPERRRR